MEDFSSGFSVFPLSRACALQAESFFTRKPPAHFDFKKKFRQDAGALLGNSAPMGRYIWQKERELTSRTTKVVPARNCNHGQGNAHKVHVFNAHTKAVLHSTFKETFRKRGIS